MLALLALLCGFVTSPAMAQEKEIATLKVVLAEGAVDQSLFSPEFLKAVPPAQLEPVLGKIKATIGPVPPAQLEPVLGKIKATIGPVVTVTHQSGATYLVETATHEVSSDIVLDAADTIAGLFFRAPVASTATIEDLLAEMAAVAPQSAFLVTENGVRGSWGSWRRANAAAARSSRCGSRRLQ